MKKKILAWLLCAVMVAVMLPAPMAIAAEKTQNAGPENSASRLAGSAGYGALPLFFIPNTGQLDARVAFAVSGTDKTVFFTKEGLTFDLSGQSCGAPQERWTLKLNFVGANRVAPESLETLETAVSYFVREPDQWHTNMQASSKIIYRDLWPGIDLIFSGAYDHLKYEFSVCPGADPAQIRLAYSGADSVTINDNRGLSVFTPICVLTDDRPLAFQDNGSSPVEAAYIPEGDEAGTYTYGFALGPYDTDKTLIIDPALLFYSGLIGGTSGDEASGIAVDISGAVYVVGSASNPTNFPVTTGSSLSVGGSGDAFIAKLNAAGTGLEYCGFIGGSDLDDATCIAVDASGCAVIGGSTYSGDFPASGAGWTGAATLKGLSDSFVAKVSADGTGLLYCGYLGGASNETVSAIALDIAGNVCVTGGTASVDFPAVGASWTGAALFNTGITDAFAAKIASDGSALQWSGFLGGTGRDSGMGIAADATGVYVTGQTRSADYPVVSAAWTGAAALKGSRDAFVTKLAVDGSVICYSGYFGGNLDDDAYAVAVDASGCAYLTGETNSADLPVSAGWTGAAAMSGVKDAFIAKVNSTGTDLAYCGYLGGTDWDTGYGIAADASGAVYVAGDTRSANFPVIDAIWEDSAALGGNRDAFITKISPAGTALEYSGFLGGSDFDYANCIAADGSGAAYIAGCASSADFPHVLVGWPGASANQGSGDAFVAKIVQVDAPAVTTGEILDLLAAGALILGEVTDDGGDAVTERGVVYATSPDPTTVTGTAVQAAAAGMGGFSAELTGLTANTTYYVRAYAMNDVDTVYGAVRSFTTPVSVTTLTTAFGEWMLAPVAVNEATNKIYAGSLWNNKLYVFDGDTDTLSGSVSAGCDDYTLAVNERTNKIYSANGTSVFIIDGETDAVTTLTLGTGAYALAVNETTNKIYVTSKNTASPLYVIDGETDSLEATVVTGTKGCAVAVNETADEIYMADDMGGKVVVIDGTDNTVKATVTVGTRPRDIAVNETTHMLYVVNWGNLLNNGTITVIDCDDGYAAQTLTLGTKAYPYDAEVNETTDTVYVSLEAFDSVVVIDGSDNSMQTVPVGNLPHKVAVNEQTNKIYTANVSFDDRSAAGYTVTEIDGTTLDTVSFADANGPEQLALNTAANKIYLTNFDDATVTVIALVEPASPTQYVCEIVGGAQFETLDAAVAGVPADTPTTIRLLQTINRDSTLTLDGSKIITLDLNGHDLNILTTTGAALQVQQSASLTTTGSGALNAAGYVYGIYAQQSATVNITGNVSASRPYTAELGGNAGVYAFGSGVSVTVTGDVGGYTGVFASSGAEVTVNGSITGTNAGVTVLSAGSVLVSGDVSASAVSNSSCITIFSGTVHVGGNVTAAGGNDSDGIYAANASTLTVGGSVSAVRHGVTLYTTDAEITGSVSTSAAASSYTAYAGNSAVLNIGGDVAGAGDCGVVAETSGRITVAGNIQSFYTGIRVSTGAEVFALGDVTADGTVGVGVNAFETGEATIDGMIQAYKTMTFGESDGAQVTPTTKAGYLTYSDGGDYPSFVWVKDSTTLTVAGTAADDTAILQIDNKTPSARDKTWEISVTSGTVDAGVAKADVTLTGLPAGLDYTAAKGTGNTIVITLTGAVTTALTTDATVTATFKGSAVTEAGAQDSAGISLKLWYIGAGTTVVLTNEAGGLIDALIAAGHEDDTLYEVLELLQPYSSGIISDRFMQTLASSPADSEAFTVSVDDGNFAVNYPVCINADGTVTIQPIYGRDIYGNTGYTTTGSNLDGVGTIWVTTPDDSAHLIDAESSGIIEGKTAYYKAFAILWMPELPTVMTNTVESSGVTQNSANVSGSVTSAGTAAVTERGFVYSATANPTTSDSKVTAALGTGAFSATLSGLTAASTYHVRAYAISGAGTAYGADKTFTTLSGGGGGGGSGTTYTAEVKEGSTTTETLPVTVNTALKTGTASLDAVKAAALFDAANASVVMPAIPGVTDYNLEIPASALSQAQAANYLIIETPYGSAAIPENMLSDITGAENKTAGVAIGQGDKSNLTGAEKAAVGNRPLIQLTLTLNGTQTKWSNPAAPVTVTIPYKPTAEELKNPESLIIWYLDGSGKLVCVPNGHYDPAIGTVTFTITHFSKYAVGYNPVSFNDVTSGAWYFKAVSFIAARGITIGTGNGNYSPNAKLTRGEFIVLLMRAYGIAPDASPTGNFTDAGSTYYTNYLAAAKRLGISAGVGNNMYAPGREITRQEMFTLLYNALNVIDRLPQGNSGKMLSDFSDADRIASWARAAMQRLVETGTISGSGDKLSPEDTTTRAEMAQVLFYLLGK